MKSAHRRITARTVLTVGLFAATCSLVGCGDAAQPLGDGSLSLDWQVSPAGCEGAGVNEVQVRLENAHRTYSHNFACGDGTAIVEGIAASHYKLSVLGLDARGRATFASTPRTLTIGAEKLNETPLVRLTAKPADLEVSWRFDNGRVCGANGVSDVEVALYDRSSYERARERFSCNDGSGRIEGIIAGDYIIEVVAPAKEATYRGLSETTLKRGDHGQVDVALTLE